MFCTNCGAQIKEGSKFCTKCGTKIQESFMQEIKQEVNTPKIKEKQPVLPYETERMNNLDMTRPEIITEPDQFQELATPKQPYILAAGVEQPVTDMQSTWSGQMSNLQNTGVEQPMTNSQTTGMGQPMPNVQNTGVEQPVMQQTYQQPDPDQNVFAPAQPVAQKDRKKINWKLWIPISLLAAALIIGGILYAVIRLGSKDKESEALSSKGKTYKTGEEVAVGDLIYTVERATLNSGATDGDNTMAASQDEITIEITVENDGKKEIIIDEDMFQLIDREDKSYKLKDEQNNAFPDELEPGDVEKYTLIFSISAKRTSYTLRVLGGSNSKKTADIKFKVEYSVIPEKVVPPTENIAINWDGSWSRTDNNYYDGSYLGITDQGDGSFYFYFTANVGANSGEIDGMATAIDNKAVYEDLDSNYNISFLMEGDILKVTTGGDFLGVLGAGVTIDGDYTLGQPIIETPTMVSLGILDNEAQEQMFKDLVLGDYELYIPTFQTIIETTDMDGYGAKVYTGGMRGLYTVMECIVMVAPGDMIWTAIISGDTVNYYTNTYDTNYLPLTIDNWRSNFSDLEVVYMNYDWSAPGAYDASGTDGDYGVYSNYFFSELYDTAVDDIMFSPREVYYNNGELFATMYIYNGRNTSAYNITDVDIYIGNGYETIAAASFGDLSGATIEPFSYIQWTFQFSSDTVYIQDADLSYLETSSYCNYSY